MSTPQNTTASQVSANRWAGLGTRVAAAAVLIPCVLALTWLGGWWFALLVAAIGAFASIELSKLAFDGSKIQLALLVLAVIIATLLPSYLSVLSCFALIAFVWSASLLFAAARQLQLDVWRVLGVPYIATPMAAFVALRSDDTHGFHAILWIFAVVWLADTLAYVFGRSIGGPKLAPVVSPNKTWAGLLGAIVGGCLGSAAVAGFAGLSGLLALVAVGGTMAVVGQLGDLYESALKRKVGVKDSGNVIPGHGGILDRIDALLTVALAAYLVGIWRNGLSASADGLLVW